MIYIGNERLGQWHLVSSIRPFATRTLLSSVLRLEWALRSLAIALVLMVAAPQFARAQPKFGTIIELVEAREKGIASLEVSVDAISRPGREVVKSREALEDYNVELARAYKYTYTRRQVPTDVSNVARVRWDTQWTSTGQQRIEYLSPPEDGEGAISTQVERVMCFDGTRWHTIFTNGSAKPVLLESSLELPPTLEVVSLGGNVWQFANDVQARSSRTLSQVLKDAVAPSAAVSEGELVTVSFLISAAKEYPKALRPVSLRAQVSLDPKLGFAPVRASGGYVMQNADGTGLETVPGLPEFEATWSDFVEVTPGCRLAKDFLVNRFATVPMPKTSSGFQPLIKDGKPVMFMDAVQLDPDSISSLRFHIAETHYKVTTLTANGLTGPPECATTLAEGTVVQDRDSGAIYQMTGTGEAVDEAMRRMVHPQLEPKPAKSSSSFVERFALIANIAVVFGLLSLLGWRFLRKRASAT